jgi:hypothetical protein
MTVAVDAEITTLMRCLERSEITCWVPWKD